ncbi:MAG: hypothetical protein PHX82_05495 [Paracoccaceae bacterium]|jgi:hypothetical protein|nr:hypothetical protein [Paracoccaceae bacterium]
MTANSILKSAAAAALISCTLMASVAPVQAEGPGNDIRPVPRAVKTHAGKGTLRFDWLAAKPAVSGVQLAAATQAIGSGSWICSPAGFGSKSHCRKR